MSLAETLAALPGDQVVYIPGVGECTVGDIRGTEQDPALDPDRATIQMWGFIATHPDAKPWLDTGPTRAARRESVE